LSVLHLRSSKPVPSFGVPLSAFLQRISQKQHHRTISRLAVSLQVAPPDVLCGLATANYDVLYTHEADIHRHAEISVLCHERSSLLQTLPMPPRDRVMTTSVRWTCIRAPGMPVWPARSRHRRATRAVGRIRRPCRWVPWRPRLGVRTDASIAHSAPSSETKKPSGHSGTATEKRSRQE
jgi:hypothetical protein